MGGAVKESPDTARWRSQVMKPHLAAEAYSDLFALACLAGAMALLCALTWQKWGTVVVDCGREMYVPAAISQGKRLYFDIWYPYGPLVPYWHGLLFRIFGVHLWILEAAGIAIIGTITWLIYSLGRLFLPWPLAFTAGFAVLLQAFQPNEWLAGFNYVLPYSSAAPYAVLLFTVLAWILVTDAYRPRAWTMWAAGSIAGLEVLTKIEFGVTAYVLLGGAILVRALRTRGVATAVWDALACVPGALLAGTVYGWYIHTGGLYFLFGENIAILPNAYFTRSMGSHWAHISGSVATPDTVAMWAVCGVIGAPLLAACLRFASTSRWKGPAIAAAGLAIAAAHLVLVAGTRWRGWRTPTDLLNIAPFFFFNRGMILTAGLLLAWTVWKWRRREIGAHGAALALLLLAGIALDWRTMFNTQPAGYSIFYDILVLIGFLVAVKRLADAWHVPQDSRLWAGAAATLCCGLIALTAANYRDIRVRTQPIASDRGTIYEDPWTAKAFNDALAFLERERKPFAVWPEEVAFYFFSGTTAPSRWIALTPGILPPGQTTADLLAELDRKAVQYVVLSDRAAPEYGVPVFGADYNQEPYHWLEQNFHVIRTFGDFRREKPQHWAVEIWERKTYISHE